jgi:hypothetical protein
VEILTYVGVVGAEVRQTTTFKALEGIPSGARMKVMIGLESCATQPDANKRVGSGVIIA